MGLGLGLEFVPTVTVTVPRPEISLIVVIYSARTGIALALSSFLSLFSAPIQGALLTQDFIWIRPVAFSATMMTVGACCYAVTTFLVRSHAPQQVRV
ncbi:hypothetical protein C8R44DRAFT_874531 [Mycena epipterygia]|nr:hypothetical protein C8R44DRAFT_874531 [Mycena epipterygia]